jgi:uncharacterized membrane protein YcaP (DUF421 family)
MDVVFRAAAIYAFLFLFTRALGKRELSQMSAFELLVLVTMGDLVQQGVTQEDFSVTGSLLAVSTFGFLSLLLGYLSFRFNRLTPVLEGRPVLMIRDGTVLEEPMRIERLNRDEILEAARNQGIADLKDVEIGILEPDGKFSFVLVDRHQHQPMQGGQA